LHSEILRHFDFSSTQLTLLALQSFDSLSLSIFSDAVVLFDEEDEDDEDDEDDEEEDLDIGTEIDQPPSFTDFLHVYPEFEDNDESNEDTALLRSKAARTAIVITPISPVSLSLLQSAPPSCEKSLNELKIRYFHSILINSG
jgi:hypothetical protein